MRAREDDGEEQPKLPLHHRLQTTQVFFAFTFQLFMLVMVLVLVMVVMMGMKLMPISRCSLR